jgi:hypothetical protein
MSPPRTIKYRCARCGLVAASKPLPERKPGARLQPLQIYDLPEGWALISKRGPEPDVCRCVECQKDVAKGSPEVLG